VELSFDLYHAHNNVWDVELEGRSLGILQQSRSGWTLRWLNGRFGMPQATKTEALRTLLSLEASVPALVGGEYVLESAIDRLKNETPDELEHLLWMMGLRSCTKCKKTLSESSCSCGGVVATLGEQYYRTHSNVLPGTLVSPTDIIVRLQLMLRRGELELAA